MPARSRRWLAGIRALMVDDADGIVGALKAATARSDAAAYELWNMAIVPKTANQFADILVPEDAT